MTRQLDELAKAVMLGLQSGQEYYLEPWSISQRAYDVAEALTHVWHRGGSVKGKAIGTSWPYIRSSV